MASKHSAIEARSFATGEDDTFGAQSCWQANGRWIASVQVGETNAWEHVMYVESHRVHDGMNGCHEGHERRHNPGPSAISLQPSRSVTRLADQRRPDMENAFLRAPNTADCFTWVSPVVPI